MKKIITFIIVALLIILAILFLRKKKNTSSVLSDSFEQALEDNSFRETDTGASQIINETSTPAPGTTPIVWDIQGSLADVANTGGSGEAFLRYDAVTNTSFIYAEITNVPDPEGTDFYEGWIVKKGDARSPITTGRLEREASGMYTNVFEYQGDLSGGWDFYVLTLEPDDGNPAPAKHIVEGVLAKNLASSNDGLNLSGAKSPDGTYTLSNHVETQNDIVIFKNGEYYDSIVFSDMPSLYPLNMGVSAYWSKSKNGFYFQRVHGNEFNTRWYFYDIDKKISNLLENFKEDDLLRI